MSAEGSGRAPLVEIVPNFSEGRRQDVIDAILAACHVPGARMLTWQADPDHNRLDATLVGSLEAVRRSALSCAARAAELIDMEQHRGNHPRMGAVDVIPFLPVRGISMEECVELARDVAKEIGERLGIPVYCYDQAALVPERRSLAEVRKGEYEGLKADVAVGRRLPDFGPNEIGRAGAVAVGARKPLIAFNVYLDGRDEDAAKQIARSVRESSGGLKNVRAIGFFVEERGCVTVSMNLVDTDATPIYRALELVRLEASRHGLNVLDTEIVGMSPEAALTDTAAFYQHLRAVGYSATAAASILGVPRRTLRHWHATAAVPPSAPACLGRPHQHAPVAQADMVIGFLHSHGPHVGLPTLRATFPTLARAELEDLLGCYRHLWRAAHPRLRAALHWQRPGTVWAMDFTEVPRPIDQHYRRHRETHPASRIQHPSPTPPAMGFPP